MNENPRGSEVIDLARYRTSKPQNAPLPSEVERILDEITYYLLMAVRVIKSHTDTKQ